MRRLEITRALVTNPSFLLLDEPFSGIDPIVVGEAKEIISELKTKGIGILITDHNVRETLSITDRAYLISEGKILIALNEIMVNKDFLIRHPELQIGPHIMLEIQDTGCGIPEQDREHVCEVFFTTKKGTGHEGKDEEHSGLGLSLVSLLLEDYNGTIACECVPGKATFPVEIPCPVNSPDG